jgi:hypothetical protein
MDRGAAEERRAPGHGGTGTAHSLGGGETLAALLGGKARSGLAERGKAEEQQSEEDSPGDVAPR